MNHGNGWNWSPRRGPGMKVNMFECEGRICNCSTWCSSASCERPRDKSNMTDVAPMWDDRCTMWMEKVVLQKRLEGLHCKTRRKFQRGFPADGAVCHVRCFYRCLFLLRSLYLLTFEDLSGSKRKFCKPPTVSPLIDHCPTAIGWCPSTWPARERRACTSGLLPLRVS